MISFDKKTKIEWEWDNLTKRKKIKCSIQANQMLKDKLKNINFKKGQKPNLS